MRGLILIALLLSVSGHAKEEQSKFQTKPIEANTDVAQKQKEDEVTRIQKRMQSYEKRGMDYAAALWSRNDGSKKDNNRQLRSDALGYELRKTTISRTQALLTKSGNPRMVAVLKKRLAELYEKQANAELFFENERQVPKDSWKITMKRAIKIRTDLIVNHKKYIQADLIYFSLAENYKALDDIKRADFNYREVVNNYPKSAFLADALLALGNIRFDQKIFSAAKEYFAKILNVTGTPLLAYAHYKIAWAYFNEGNEKAAINSLIDSVKTGRRMNQARKRRIDVEEEALQDLVLFYAESGDPEKAKDFFGKIVGYERAKDLRYMLARRYFAHDKHEKALLVSTSLLNDSPEDSHAGQLLMIALSISEKTKKRQDSVLWANKLASWVTTVRKKFDGKPFGDEIEMVMTDTEETIRRLAHRLHFDAQSTNSSRLWKLAKTTYETYFNTYEKAEELSEMRYRYSALLFKLKLNPETHKSLEILLTMIQPGHKRYQEALKLRIQSIEQATAEQKKYLTDKLLIVAYDEYAKAFPQDSLAVEALFKAAKLAKTEEGPVKAAVRFRILANTYPSHKLRDEAVQEALASLLNAKEWKSLAEESKTLIGVVANAHESKTGEKLVDDEGSVNMVQIDKNPIYRKLINARNTAMLKIAEEFEAQAKYDEAEKAYLDFIDSRKNSTLRPMALVKLASMTENKVQNYLKAVEYWERIDKEYGNTETGSRAELEQARIHEIVMRPKQAVINYLNFAEKGNSKLHFDSRTNAAVILEALGEWNLAANNFLQLSNEFAKSKNNDQKKQAGKMYQFSCKNRLLAVADGASEDVLEKLLTCAQVLSTKANRDEQVLWLVRGAWTAEKMGNGELASTFWAQLAARRNELIRKPELSYFLAMAKTKQLVSVFARYKDISFASSNENPNANIARKTKALEQVEAVAADIMKYGSDREIKIAKSAMNQAYINFGETLETSAVPSGLSEVDEKVLRQSFLQAAQEMKKKAEEYVIQPDDSKKRDLASVDEVKERSFPSLGNDEFKQLVVRAANNPNDVEAYARLAYHMFEKNEFATARYISMKWESLLDKGKDGGEYSKEAYQLFRQQVGLKVPEKDPILLDIQKSSGGA